VTVRRLPFLAPPVKLDLGCGQNKIDGFVGLDCNDHGQEILWDANQGIPLPDDSVEALHASHFLEHLKWEELPNLFAEIVRVCKDGAYLTFIAPHADTKEAFYLCHHTRWNDQVVEGIVADHRNLTLVRTGRNGIHFLFDLIVVKGRPKP
jgi:predicted SAM-dependent methyltransferase